MKRSEIRLLPFVFALIGLSMQPFAGAAPPEDDASIDEAPSSEQVHEESAKLIEFLNLVEAWQLDEATRELESLAGLERELASGVLAIYEARYVDAERALAGVVAARMPASEGDEPAAAPDAFTARAQHYLAVARGAQIALGDAIVVRSDDGRFEAVFADRKDQILAPYLFDAMGSAYEVLGEEIGERPDHPIRFEIYDEPGKLALVTPLTLDNIYTTGTVGICKYRRIMMITPRVMVYGYGWLDTAVHEYVHYVVTLRTHNEAPVWMQEGLAKLFESRWREGAAEPLDPPIRRLLHDALVHDQLVTLEQMHPSIAMLPSQEMAALAYAEAETMLGLLAEERGQAGLGALMDEVGRGVDAKQAFAHAWGDEFERFFEVWKQTMRTRTAAGGRGTDKPLSDIEFRDDPDAAEPGDPSLAGDVFSHLGGGRARQHARLGVLLTLRGHREAAVIEYEKARAVDRKVRDDPQLGRRLGELYLELDRAAEALPLLELASEAEPDDPNLAAALGRARLQTGDREGARAALDLAIRQNPFIPAIHCDLAELAEDPLELAREKAQCVE
ncbi:peptidase MA family metallohydrolase [Nannocystaceae bacterium ST9]